MELWPYHLKAAPSQVFLAVHENLQDIAFFIDLELTPSGILILCKPARRYGNGPEPFSNFFIGQAYLKPLTDKDGPIANVTFGPGCWNNWHTHHKGGQILLVTGGKGWCQAWGEPARELKPGDVVNISPKAKHWRGAAADSWFSLLAIEIPAESGAVEWLAPVEDDVYRALSC